MAEEDRNNDSSAIHHDSNEIDINWNELMWLSSGTNDAEEPVIIPMIQVDTHCQVAIVPTNVKKNKVVVEETPMDYTYHITVRAVRTATEPDTDDDDADADTTPPNDTTASNVTIEMYSIDATTMESTLQSLLCWLQESNHHTEENNNNNNDIVEQQRHWNVSIQAFPQQPRQVLPSLHRTGRRQESSTSTTMTTTKTNRIRTLSICYFTITTAWDWNCSVAPPPEAMEFVQCTMSGDWNRVLRTLSPPLPPLINSPLECSTKSITLSCTLPEFVKFVAFLQQEQEDGAGVSTLITALHFKLHFFLPDHPVMVNFSEAMANCSALTTLSLQYLDLSDTGWAIFCTTLAQRCTNTQLRSLSLSYTDNFVDTYRRLTTERCTQRTRVMKDLVEALPSLHHIDFPPYQQDAAVMNDIRAILEERRTSGA